MNLDGTAACFTGNFINDAVLVLSTLTRELSSEINACTWNYGVNVSKQSFF